MSETQETYALERSLLPQGILLLRGDVDGEMAQMVIEGLNTFEAMGAPDIEVRITSPGGDVSVGLDIYDMLRRYKGKKTGVVYGFAHSMGAIILQGCDHRIALKNSTVLIHHVLAREVSLATLRNKAELKKLIADMEEQHSRLLSILEGRSGKPLTQIEEVCTKDVPVRAEEALALGLIDEIF